MEGECLAAINRIGRAALGAFPSIPLGIVAAESGLALARVLLDHRHAGFTQRLLARPRGLEHGGDHGTPRSEPDRPLPRDNPTGPRRLSGEADLEKAPGLFRAG